jgi:hypothetical protein
MISQRHSETHAGEPSVDAPPPGSLRSRPPSALRSRSAATGRTRPSSSPPRSTGTFPRQTSSPQSSGTGDPDPYKSEVLYSEPDGSLSIVALVWRPGQVTPIHDHVTWCVFGVIQGVEREEPFALEEHRACLVEAGYRVNGAGDVSGFAPPGDIHRARQRGAISPRSQSISMGPMCRGSARASAATTKQLR